MKKNSFKKFTAVATTLTLTLGMSINAFAADQFDTRTGKTASGNTGKTFEKDSTTNKLTGTTTGDVKVEVEGADTTARVYRIDVEWDSLVFTYVFENDAVWNPDAHTYGEIGAGSWKDNKDTANIVVKNHSNDGVKVTSKFKDESATESGKQIVTNGVKAVLTPDSGSAIESAVGTDFDNAPKETITVTVSGDPNQTSDIAVGTVEVKIEAATAET